MEMRRDSGGRELQMRYTFNSLCAMEERAGGGLAQWNNRQYTPVRLLFWGALIDRQPEITLTEAGNLIGGHIASGGTLEQIAQLCLEALEAAGFCRDEDE